MGLLLFDDDYIARGIKGDYSGGGQVKLGPLETILLNVIKLGMAIAQAVVFVICRIPLVSSLYESFARTYSRGAAGFFLRASFYKNRLRRMGQNVFIDVGVTIWEPGNVEIGSGCHIDTYVNILGGAKGHGFVRIGKHVHVASFCVLAGRGGIEIGDYAAVAAGSNIYSGTNYYKNPDGPSDRLLCMSAAAPLDMQYVIEKPVAIGEYAFIGLDTIVLPGVTVGKAAVVGAGSMVGNDIPPFAIAVGSPAKVVKQRPSL
jgi:galactoside O-acetyltransferase